MISALPALLGQRLAGAVDALAGDMGLFTDPCGSSEAPVDASAPAPHVFVQMAAVDWEDQVGQRSPGQEITHMFAADVTLDLLGPETPALGGTERAPTTVPVLGRDLMLTAAMDALNASDETSNQTTDSASLIANGRRHAAEWRCDTIGDAMPTVIGTRSVWTVETRFRGKMTLSPVPAEGGRILRAEIAQDTDGKPTTGRVEATAELMPISYFAAIGPGHANRLAAFGLQVTRDLADIPLAELQAHAAAVAGTDANLAPSLTALHTILHLRRDVAEAGLIGGQLFARHAALLADEVWSDATDSYTPPADMRDDQRLRAHLLAQPLLPLLSDEARTLITFGQLCSLPGDVTG